MLNISQTLYCCVTLYRVITDEVVTLVVSFCVFVLIINGKKKSQPSLSLFTNKGVTLFGVWKELTSIWKKNSSATQ